MKTPSEKVAKKREVISFETFRDIGTYELMQLKDNEPSAFNGWVRVEKVKITIEPVEESKEVYAERLNKLWRESDNHHHYQPILKKARSMGIELNSEYYGKDRKKK